jgi:ribosome-associated protein
MDDLIVNEHVTIPADDLVERFTTSGGPGGQHANRSETAVTLVVDLDTCRGLDDDLRRRAIGRLGHGEVSVTVADSRSQFRNRQIARRRMVGVLADALKPPPPSRRPTRPSRSTRARRLEAKRRRGEIKRGRGRPDDDAG